jgi:hypothetical protein
MARVLEAPAPPLSAHRPDLPPGLAAAVDRCLAKSLADRFPSAIDFLQALTTAEAPGWTPPAAVGHRAPASPARLPAWWRIHQAIIIGLYGLAVAGGWQIREWVEGWASSVFLLIAVSATIGGMFRGHLLFSNQENQNRFASELRRARPITAGTDFLIAAALLIDGVAVVGAHPAGAALVVALGVGVGLARLVIEPSTESGAFGAPA